jgi:hypothetical protein
MTGPNGCGKSSVFDAFTLWHMSQAGLGAHFHDLYYPKVGLPREDWNQIVKVDFFEKDPQALGAEERKKIFYVRSAYRNEPEFIASAISKAQPVLNDVIVRRLIDNDVRVSGNYQRLVSSTVAAVFDGNADGKTVGNLRDELIGQIRASMTKVFEGLVLSGPGNPLENGTFFFEKGRSKGFQYMNLSGGEKAAFDLLLDLVVKRSAFDDTVFCIDEPELHMHTRLQASLLDEFFRLIPGKCQLWIATHSIGMMRKAMDLAKAHPNEVAFLDFHGGLFDDSAIVEPTIPNRAFWGKMLEVALDDLAALVAPAKVVLCEGKPLGPSRPDRAEFDAACYRKIFASEFPDVDFLSVGNSSDVQTDRLAIGTAIQALVTETEVIRVIDHDDMSEREVADQKKVGVRVLSKRHLEAYLMDDEILESLCEAHRQPGKFSDLKEAKKKAVEASVQRGNPVDDIKSAAGDIYTAAKRLLKLTSCGNTAEAFCRDTLAPLIQPATKMYNLLRQEIFG